MGDIIDNINAAANGNPYSGDGNTNIGQGNQSTIMGEPTILKHSLDSIPEMSDPMFLFENKMLENFNSGKD